MKGYWPKHGVKTIDRAKLRALIKREGVSAAELAEILQLNKNTFYSWLTHGRMPGTVATELKSIMRLTSHLDEFVLGDYYFQPIGKDPQLPTKATLESAEVRSEFTCIRTPMGDIPRVETVLGGPDVVLTPPDSLLNLLLSKLPQFDPTWGEKAQESWFIALERITSLKNS